MKVKILAFGIAEDIFRSPVIEEDLPQNSSVKGLVEHLKKRFPKLNELASFLIAVNNEYASPEYLIKEKDEIAIIPPVSGG
jgi:molybdopterin converting factor subunit 1